MPTMLRRHQSDIRQHKCSNSTRVLRRSRNPRRHLVFQQTSAYSLGTKMPRWHKCDMCHCNCFNGTNIPAQGCPGSIRISWRSRVPSWHQLYQDASERHQHNTALVLQSTPEAPGCSGGTGRVYTNTSVSQCYQDVQSASKYPDGTKVLTCHDHAHKAPTCLKGTTVPRWH